MSTIELFLHFLIGLGVSFLGALPLGIVNLSVIDVTANENFRAGLNLSFGASVIEVIHFLLAFWLGALVIELLEGNIYVQVFVVVLFLSLGLVYFFKPKKDKAKCPIVQLSNFLKGIVLSAINPQAIPFWVFVIAGLNASGWVMLNEMAGLQWMLIFLFGVWVGKILALVLFGKLSLLIVSRLSSISGWMNKIIGGVLFLIAGWQLVHLFTT